jgi:hypothetical protein
MEWAPILCVLSRMSTSNQMNAITLLAFPLTTGGSVMQTKQQNFVKKVIKKTKKAISWEDIVDNKIGWEVLA